MRNAVNEYWRAVNSWWMSILSNGQTRTLNALDAMRAGNYTASNLMRDAYDFWLDVADFRAPAALGWIPTASLRLTAWAGTAPSNFVMVPRLPLNDFGLTPVVNPQTNTVLQGLSLDATGVAAGDPLSSLRVLFTAPGGAAPANPADRNGLFQGAIVRNGTDETVALVVARLELP